MLKKIFSVFLMVVIAKVAFLNLSVVEASEVMPYEKWNHNKVVAPTKEWTIKFSQEIDPVTVNSENVFIVYKSEKLANVKLEVQPDKKSILVKLNSGVYKAGEEYLLRVQNIKSNDGSSLKKFIEFRFVIDDNVGNIVESTEPVDTENIKFIYNVYTEADVKLNIENKTIQLINYNEEYKNAFYLYMYGKYSNRGNYFVNYNLLTSLVPELSGDLVNELKHMELQNYNGSLFLNLVNVIRFYREYGYEVNYRVYNEQFVAFDIVKTKN